MSAVAGAAGPTTAADRAALLRKYRVLAEWRRRKDAETTAETQTATATKAETETSTVGVGAGANTGPVTQRDALRSLSVEFPGALRELDVLGLPEIVRRIARLSDASTDVQSTSGDPRQADRQDDRWMTWIAAYHAVMRVALAIKRAASRARRSEGTLSGTSDTAGTSGKSGLSIADHLAMIQATPGMHFIDDSLGESFVRAVIRPPAGRVGIVVLTALSAHFQVPAIEISRTLFPPRRPPPYSL